MIWLYEAIGAVRDFIELGGECPLGHHGCAGPDVDFHLRTPLVFLPGLPWPEGGCT